MPTDEPGQGAPPPWRGFHHVALVTPDLDATIRFYGEILGMHVDEIAPASGPRGRHCFIRPGEPNVAGTEGFGIETSPVTRFGPIANMLFLDNNDQLVEATWRVE